MMTSRIRTRMEKIKMDKVVTTRSVTNRVINTIFGCKCQFLPFNEDSKLLSRIIHFTSTIEFNNVKKMRTVDAIILVVIS